MAENGEEGVLEDDFKNKIRHVKQIAINLELSEIIFKLFKWEKREVLMGEEILPVKSKYYEENSPKELNDFKYNSKYWQKFNENPDTKDFKHCYRMVINNKTFDFLYRERLSLILRAKEWATLRLLVNGKKVYEFNLEGRDRTYSSIWEVKKEPNAFIQGELRIFLILTTQRSQLLTSNFLNHLPLN